MSNFTIEDYKEAIRAKYEKDVNNPLSDDLRLLGQAYLRDLCWEKFEGGLSEDDLKVFASFFGFEFNPVKRNLFRDKTDKFKPIGTFLKRQTDLSSREAVDLTAILVDFQHRPFRKFKEKGIIAYLIHPEDSKTPEPIAAKEEDEVKVKEDEQKEEVNPAAKTFVGNLVAEIQIKGFADVEPDLRKEEESKTLGQVEVMPVVPKPQSISLFVIAKDRIRETLTKKLWRTAAVIAIVFVFGFGISYYAFPKKQCMQWNNDHYDIVDCDLEVNGLLLSSIEPLDEKRIDFRKLKVCDTTNCFRKDGEAFVWYTKTPDGIDFFNSHGRHPEYNRPLRPVSHYIFNKYVKGKPCK